jgi:succinate dehydrogenase/fumarate reductase cytochrome b subunit
MMNTRSTPKPGETTWLWMLKIFSGLLILVILIIHFLVNHFLAPEGLLSFEEIIAYYQNFPIVPIMEGFFVVFVVSHSLLGVRSIVLDLNPSKRTSQIVDVILVGIGVVSVVYGIWLLTAILAQAPAA